MPSASVAVAVSVSGPGALCDVVELASETFGAWLTAPTETLTSGDEPVAPRLSVATAVNL